MTNREPRLKTGENEKVSPKNQAPSTKHQVQSTKYQAQSTKYKAPNMSADDNITIIRRFVDELWNERNLSVADEIFASECLTHQLRSGDEISSAPRDPETLKKHVSEWLAAFPDLHFTLEQTVAGDDRVASQISMTGTHTGDWMGIPPTGKHVSVRMMTIHRIVAGKIVEDWVLVDSLGLFQQLALVPPREEIFAKANVR